MYAEGESHGLGAATEAQFSKKVLTADMSSIDSAGERHREGKQRESRVVLTAVGFDQEAFS